MKGFIYIFVFQKAFKWNMFLNGDHKLQDCTMFLFMTMWFLVSKINLLNAKKTNFTKIISSLASSFTKLLSSFPQTAQQFCLLSSFAKLLSSFPQTAQQFGQTAQQFPPNCSAVWGKLLSSFCQIAVFFCLVLHKFFTIFLFVFIFGAGFLFKSIGFFKIVFSFLWKHGMVCFWTTPWTCMWSKKKGISTTEPVWKSFFVPGTQHTRQSSPEHRGLECLEVKLHRRCLATIEKTLQFHVPTGQCQTHCQTECQSICQEECQTGCQSMPDRMSEYMSLPISNIASQCQLLGCVLTSVNQMSKEASPVSVWNCCAMTPTFAVQWSLLLVWPQIFIKIMCLKGNFSPMVASMHGNEALKTHPMPQKKWNNNTRMSAWRLSNGF